MSEMTRPAATTVAVTPSNSTDIAQVYNQYPRALFVGTGGDVAVVTPDAAVATLKNVASGTVLPIQTRRVNSTNTTAADIVALY